MFKRNHRWLFMVLMTLGLIFIIGNVIFDLGKDVEAQSINMPANPYPMPMSVFQNALEHHDLNGKVMVFANGNVYFQGIIKDLSHNALVKNTSATSSTQSSSKAQVVSKVPLYATFIINDFANLVNMQTWNMIKNDKDLTVLGDLKQAFVNPIPGKTAQAVSQTMSILVGIASLAFYAMFIFLIYKQSAMLQIIDRFRVVKEDTGIKLDDVAGMESAKREVAEIVEYLKDKDAFHSMGAKSPKGILLYGPPGNGKTMLAKAIAGECGVPFIEQNGGNIMGKFLGESADGIKKLFKTARKLAKEKGGCIIFIDEIDAIGASRWSRSTISHSENHSALDTLLAEMDGFYPNTGIVVVAATNNADILDPALVRPGRFDRKVYIPLPGVLDREKILNIYLKKIPCGEDIDVKALALMSPGFSGADLSNWVNEAAIQAARDKSKQVLMRHFSTARDIILAGPLNTSMNITDKELSAIAYHEAGHAIVSHFTGGYVDKVSIQPRGRALGITFSTPEDMNLHTEEHVKNQLMVLLAGRAAEEMFVKYISSGASNDLERASQMAYNAVTHLGLGDRGLYVPQTEKGLQSSEESAARLIEECYEKTKEVLQQHKYEVESLHEALMAHKEVNFREFIVQDPRTEV